MNKLYEIKNLSIGFQDAATPHRVVDRISFDIYENQTIAIVGESGSGKTLTAKSLIGLIKQPGFIYEGSLLLYKNKNIAQFTPKEWDAFRGNEVAMIFQDALVSLNPTMKVGKQIIESLDNHYPQMSTKEKQQKALDLLSAIEIHHPHTVMNKYPHELSGGMRQRMMIASAIISQPQIILADEPTTSLDVTTQAQIIQLLKKIQIDFNLSIVLITHNLGIVAEIADYILVMRQGQIIERGTCEEIFYTPKHAYTKALLKAVPTL